MLSRQWHCRCPQSRDQEYQRGNAACRCALQESAKSKTRKTDGEHCRQCTKTERKHDSAPMQRLCTCRGDREH